MDASWTTSLCCCPVLAGVLREICSAGATKRLNSRGGRFMNQLVPFTNRAPALIAAAGARASYAISCGAARRRCSIRPRRASSSTRSTSRPSLACATMRVEDVYQQNRRLHRSERNFLA